MATPSTQEEKERMNYGVANSVLGHLYDGNWTSPDRYIIDYAKKCDPNDILCQRAHSYLSAKEMNAAYSVEHSAYQEFLAECNRTPNPDRK